jgi:hypothetical protein
MAKPKNAADRIQVAFDERKAKERAALFLASLRELMQSEASRRVMWELLDLAGVFRSIWTPNAEIHYRAGRQDFGHELMALLHQAGEDHYAAMESEARARARRDAEELAAILQSRASPDGDEQHG